MVGMLKQKEFKQQNGLQIITQLLLSLLLLIHAYFNLITL